MQNAKEIFTTVLGGFLLFGASLAFAAGAATPQDAPQKDPMQWSTPDTTPQARYQTAKKEAGAALQEAQNGCRNLRGADRAGCMKEAQSVYAQDLVEAKKLLNP